MFEQIFKKKDNTNFKVTIQQFGRFLSGMVMPNIGAFIAWGIITALFIPTGWFPNETLSNLVEPTIKYMLPLLIGYTGGYNIYGQRGGVVAAIAVMGVIIGTEIPMFIGAMIIGPLSAWLIKKFDKLIEGKTRSGFEMLVNNFSAGIIGGILMILAFLAGGPIFSVINHGLSIGIQAIIDAKLLPLSSILVAPAQVLFLNNAINHGILVPLGVQQAAETGKSILFMVEACNAPLSGVMLAYCLFGKGIAKRTAPAAFIIAWLGGIAEVYFPYVLMNPVLIIATILGGISMLTIFTLFDGGLVAVPSPGSVILFLAMTPKGSFLVNVVGYVVGMIVSFLVASFILKRSKYTNEGNDDLNKANDKMEDLKGDKSIIRSVIAEQSTQSSLSPNKIKKIIFACDAGMGSSAMGASILNKKMKEAGLDMVVTNKAINEIPGDVDLVITHRDLVERVSQKVPGVRIISVDNFLNDTEYDKLINELKRNSN